MRRRLPTVMLVLGILFLTACGETSGKKPVSKVSGNVLSSKILPENNSKTGKLTNAEKPLIWFNRQPSDGETGKLDMKALNFNKDTYYVGFDAKQGGLLQGQMIKDYIDKYADKIDRNSDGIIGYVLAIGDIRNNDSIARTRGVRKILGTGIEKDGVIISDAVGNNIDGSSTIVKDGKIKVRDKVYTIREIASQEMKTDAGATWDTATATIAVNSWSSLFPDDIDMVISNNDGMAMSIFNTWSKDKNVPTFGYDANSDAVAAIEEGYAGTISQHTDVQAYLTFRLIRNILDGVNIGTGISTSDEEGNVLSVNDYEYKKDIRAYYALNEVVTKDNYKQFLDAVATFKSVSEPLNKRKHPKKKVWLNIFDLENKFLSETYQPLLQKYEDLLNFNVEYVAGDGRTEADILSRLCTPDKYDAFAINMVKTSDAEYYTSILK